MCVCVYIPALQSLLSTYSPLELMQCLCELTVEATEDIHTITADVNLNRDAKLLRWVELTRWMGLTMYIVS